MVQKAILLGVALCGVVWLASAATTASKKKPARKRSHAASVTGAANTKKTNSKATPRSRASVAKSAKGSKTARRSSGPRQLAPTKERYQQIQQALAGKGYFSGEANGAWGADSIDALKRFQADQNLTPDGKLTSLSLIALGLGPKRLSAQSPAPPAHADQQQ